MPINTPPVVLTIAGSDSGGGAGIQADLKTFEAHRVFGTTAITAITAQNTLGVQAVVALKPALVKQQIAAVLSDFSVAAIKVGMLANKQLVQAVASMLQGLSIPLVVDPVFLSTSGHRLLAPSALVALQQELLPLAKVITPNRLELEALLGQQLTPTLSLGEAALLLQERYPLAAVLAKGGHPLQPGTTATDYLAENKTLTNYSLPWLLTQHTHGTGCTLAAALTARLALGCNLQESVRLAKAYVHAAMLAAPALGHGHGPLCHQVSLPL